MQLTDIVRVARYNDSDWVYRDMISIAFRAYPDLPEEEGLLKD